MTFKRTRNRGVYPMPYFIKLSQKGAGEKQGEMGSCSVRTPCSEVDPCVKYLIVVRPCQTTPVRSSLCF